MRCESGYEPRSSAIAAVVLLNVLLLMLFAPCVFADSGAGSFGTYAATILQEADAPADVDRRVERDRDRSPRPLSLQDASGEQAGGLPRTIVPADAPARMPYTVSDSLTRPVGSGPGAVGIAGGAAGRAEGANPPGGGANRLTFRTVLDGYLFVFVIAFIVTVAITPFIRRLAEQTEIVDTPSNPRKEHRQPVAYLGGLAVFVGMMAGILSSYFFAGYESTLAPVPINILIAMAAVLVTGLLDDIFSWDPNLKLGGQCFAAAALALDDDIGGRVAEGLLRPLEAPFGALLNMPGLDFTAIDVVPGSGVWEVDLVYWCGAAVIAVFVIGGCNAANLIDGLDGLLAGTTAVMATGLLIICALLASMNYGNLDGARIVVCYALLGAALGFLPHNFRPANIFLGDAGSLLIGFTIIVIILMLGERGQTHLVFAGLIVFGLPILDATLAIIRRRMSGMPISHGDSNHLHHLLKRTRLRTVGAVFVLYSVSACFAAIGVGLVFLRARWVYALGLVLAGFIIVTGIKAAERRRLSIRDENARGETDSSRPARGAIVSQTAGQATDGDGEGQRSGAVGPFDPAKPHSDQRESEAKPAPDASVEAPNADDESQPRQPQRRPIADSSSTSSHVA